MLQLLERKRKDKRTYAYLQHNRALLLWDYPITKPSTVCSNMSKNAPNDKIQSPCRFIDLLKLRH